MGSHREAIAHMRPRETWVREQAGCYMCTWAQPFNQTITLCPQQHLLCPALRSQGQPVPTQSVHLTHIPMTCSVFTF